MTYYIGLMSGTSVDSIDAALVSFEPDTQLIASSSTLIPDDLSNAIHGYYDNPTISLKALGELNVRLGDVFADAVDALVKSADVSSERISAIGSHGQTLFHQPSGQHPFTLQLGDPSVIAARTGITTIANFRNKDMALGGQGAPLTPLFHEALFRSKQCNRAVINIGGIANVTLLPNNMNQPILGFDTGPGNTLLDRWAAKHIQQPYDKDGLWAQQGHTIPLLLEALLEDPYFSLPTPKSTGREYFNLDWLQRHLAGSEHAQDVQKTLTELTARSISDSLLAHSLEECDIILCGGGVHNRLLTECIQVNCGARPVVSSAKFGIDPDWIEAMAFAWFAKQTLNKTAINLTSITGSSRPTILGGIYWA